MSSQLSGKVILNKLLTKILTALLNKVDKSGDTMSGNLFLQETAAHNFGINGTYLIACRSDTDVRVGVGVGTGGANHGLYSGGSGGLSNWIIYSNGTNIYMNGVNYTSDTANTVLAAPNGSTGKPTFRALVAADIPSLAADKITSGTFDAARIPGLNASKITAGTLPIARGGTGKTYGYTWQSLGSTTGTTALTIDVSDYSEVCVVCRHSTDYMGSIVLPKAQLHASTQREVYCGGAYTSSSGNRRAVAKISQVKLTPVVVTVDGTAVTSSATWWVYAR